MVFLDTAKAGCSGTASYETPAGGCGASAYYSASYDCTKAKDGNTGGGYWTTGCTSPPQWIYFDLGASKCISGVQIFISDVPAPETMDIQVSNDASSWTTVVSGWTISNDGTWVSKTFSETTRRYVRVYITGLSDNEGYCPGSQGYASISEFQAYTRQEAPSITTLSDSPDPVTAGSPITFNVAWSDPNAGDQTRIHICKTNAISGQTCSGGSWCDTASFSSTSPAACSYTTTGSDVGARTYYSFVCDDDNACSASTSGSFTVNAANQAPAITTLLDSPDPVTAGSNVQFSVGWSDPNTGDLTKIHICKTNSISGQTCSGGSWCDTASFSSTSPATCSYTTTGSDVGAKTYYAFVCDDDNACSASTSGSFTVPARYWAYVRDCVECSPADPCIPPNDCQCITCTTITRECKSCTKEQFEAIHKGKMDDPSVKAQIVGNNYFACPPASNDKACCSKLNSCVYNGLCYDDRTKLDIDGDSINEICIASSPGQWVDDFETDCSNNIDDDFDGLTDCQDPDCQGSISGNVKNVKNQNIADARVEVIPHSSPNSDYTDSFGNYQLNNILCGTYNLIASAVGYVSSTKPNINLPPRTSITVDFTGLILGTTCEDDCTYAGDNMIHKECDGIDAHGADLDGDGRTDCDFYDNTAKEVCNFAQPGWIRSYDATHEIECAEGAPREKHEVKAVITCEQENLIKLTKLVTYKGKLVKLVVVTCG